MNNIDRIKSLPIWTGNIEISPLEGGITNFNYLVKDTGKESVVRMGSDIPEHLVYRSNEILVSKAAFELSLIHI